MLKIAAVGCGAMLRTHCRYLSAMEDVALVGFCDTDGERAEGAAKDFGGQAFTDHQALYDKTEPDAVYVCVPPYAHGPIEVDAAARGIHLFIESPIALDHSTATKVAAEVRKKKVLTCVGYGLRYCDTVNRARQYLKGKAISLVLGYCLGGLQPQWWWRRREYSGGQFLEEAAHTVDLLRYLCGDVGEVFALASGGCMNQVAHYDIDDSSAVILRLKSGAAASINTTCINGRQARIGIEAIAPEITISLEDAVLHVHEGKRTTIHRPAHDRYAAENRAFIEAVRTGKRNKIRSSYNDARKTLAVALAANESITSGLPINP
ncbi:MAG: Gfo/Idh/MocA family protein [Candidatus Hydrogenedentota bacterium]